MPIMTSAPPTAARGPLVWPVCGSGPEAVLPPRVPEAVPEPVPPRPDEPDCPPLLPDAVVELLPTLA